MKKVLFLAVFTFAAVPVLAQIRYTVNGIFAENGKKIYLTDQLTDKTIDSTFVADNKFTFTGTADQDALMSIKAEKQRWEMQFFNDGTPVIINLSDSTLQGSPQNERLAQLVVQMDLPRKIFSDKIGNMSEAEIEAREDEISDAMNKMLDEMKAIALKAFNEEHQSMIPVAFAGFYFLENGPEAYDELVKQQVAYAKHPYLKKMRDDVEAMTRPADSRKTAFIGQPYTDLEMAAPDGQMHKISELVGEGKYVLVDFWASWCGPCRAEMPNVLEAYNQFHDKGFEVIGVSFDQKKEAWVKAIGQLNMPWLQISDLKGWQCAAASVYKIDGIPDNILIDPQGKIIDRGLRGKTLHRRLRQLLGE